MSRTPQPNPTRPMEPVHTSARVIIRDLLIFQLKLVIDGLKDIALIQISFGAAVFDLIFGRKGRPLLFYSVLRLSERFDLWVNLYGAAEGAQRTKDGLFGSSRAGSNSLLGRLEQLVRQKVEGYGPEATGN